MKKSQPATTESPQTDPEVDAFLAKLKHPLKTEIAVTRQIILSADPAIGEGVKWNAPSFRTTEFFATINLRSVDQLQLILHLGAKVRTEPKAVAIADPSGLLKMLGKDRALVTLGAGKEFAANRAAFQEIVREWIKHV